MSAPQFNNILITLTELKQDNTLPKNMQVRLTNAIKIISEGKDEFSIKKSKIISELEEMNEDVNIQPYVRNQIFTVFSLLEGI